MNRTGTKPAGKTASNKTAAADLPDISSFIADRDDAAVHRLMKPGRASPSLLECVSALHNIDAINSDITDQIEAIANSAMTMLRPEVVHQGTPGRGLPTESGQSALYHAATTVHTLLLGLRGQVQDLSDSINSTVGDLGILCVGAAGYDAPPADGEKDVPAGPTPPAPAPADTAAEASTADTDERLDLVGTMCSDMASSLCSIRDGLLHNAENAETVYALTDALARVGWMADRAAKVAGSTMCTNSPDGWMVGVITAERLHAVQEMSA